MCAVLSCFSHVRLFATLWTVASQAPLYVGFSRQGYWSGLPFPSPGDPPDPEIKPSSPALAGRLFTPEPPEKPCVCFTTVRKIKVGMEMSPTSLGSCERKKS